MTTEARREGGTRLCRQLTESVSKLAPKGIGGRSRTWDIVAAADAAFMEALTRWEATGDDADKPALRTAYYSVLDAWRRAVADYVGTAGLNGTSTELLTHRKVKTGEFVRGARDPMKLASAPRPHGA